jgi:hypothetical protein
MQKAFIRVASTEHEETLWRKENKETIPQILLWRSFITTKVSFSEFLFHLMTMEYSRVRAVVLQLIIMYIHMQTIARWGRFRNFEFEVKARHSQNCLSLLVMVV